MIPGGRGCGKTESDLSRVCGDDPLMDNYFIIGGSFVPRMRG